MRNGADPHEHLPLHPFEFRILLALIDGPSYGTRIVQEIEARVGDREKIYPANLYRRVRDLLKSGLLEEVDSPKGADPRRTYLQLTVLGRAVAQAEARRLRELLDEAAGRQLLPEA
ncbi:MAG: PadR family transcriptional regulator [Gemmatimonadota bacterium]|nr:PadR family transcriptional regulator [Gemmatimonadota bacterium]